MFQQPLAVGWRNLVWAELSVFQCLEKSAHPFLTSEENGDAGLTLRRRAVWPFFKQQFWNLLTVGALETGEDSLLASRRNLLIQQVEQQGNIFFLMLLFTPKQSNLRLSAIIVCKRISRDLASCLKSRASILSRAAR